MSACRILKNKPDFTLFPLVSSKRICYTKNRKQFGREDTDTMENFFTDDDLLDLLEELDEENAEIEILESEIEMKASNRRFEEIILKHRND